jgi:IclR family transcriptional regulator, KDG regulon repressor
MSEIQSLGRGLQILNLIAQADRSLSVTELAFSLGVDKSSASRLVKTLASYGYVQQEPGSRRFCLGNRIYEIGWHLINQMPIRQKARPYLFRLMRETGECSHTAVYAEGKALVIDDIEGEAKLRVVGGIGRMIPLHCTAVGKGLLAFSNLPIPSQLETLTEYTITDAAALRDHLAETRRKGYAYDDQENDPGVRCIAAPVFGMMGSAIATIGISGPTVRITDDRVELLATIVMQAARELSIDLGYTTTAKRVKNNHR